MKSEINPLFIKYSDPQGIFFVDGKKLAQRDLGLKVMGVYNKNYTLASACQNRDPSEVRYDRDHFTHDRDKILWSAALRRLMTKSQVIINPLDSEASTRYSHTVEVTHVGRSVCRNLAFNEILAEVIGLGHDLGHTPFGHVGETGIENVVRMILGSSNYNFHHASYGIEVVERIENLKLTAEVKDGIQKHSTGDSKLDEGTDLPYTPEGKIIRLADKAAYTTSDVRDALKSGIIKEHQLPQAAMKVLGYTQSDQLFNIIQAIMLSCLRNQQISFDGEVFDAFEELRGWMYKNVYRSGKLKEQRKQGEKMVGVVFERIREEDFGHLDQENAINKTIDKIASMTDRSLITYYNDNFDGSIVIPRL
tara:strand:- start:2479 stop:3567 length:1089 start_codon:yes stop_codon:yes gene_type:complete